MAGGFKKFGPTYNSTPYVRLGYEGILNGAHPFDPVLLNGVNEQDEPKVELAGKFAAIGRDGVRLAGEGGHDAVGLFREDLQDMVNASERATFYFRGGEYYVNIKRTGLSSSNEIAAGDEITCDAQGRLIKKDKNDNTKKALGVVTYVGEYRAGNMYQNATKGVPDADTFIGFIMFI